jgi:preprotein translocase subunit SecF
VLFVGLAAGAYSSIFLATPIVADLKEREPEVQALRRRVLARRSSQARQGADRATGAGAVASARRAGGAARRPAGVALAEREEDLRPARADVVVESPESVRPDAGRAAQPSRSGATAAPRPGARPQQPGTRRSSGRKRR